MGPRLAATLAGLAALAAGGCGGGDRDAPASRHDPILFVHGLHGSAAAWRTDVARFAADGWPRDRLFAWSYDSSRSNVVTAHGVATEVRALLRRTGAAKVDLVTHSMGAFSTRWYIARLGGVAHVDAWVSLAGPNNGTTGLPECHEVSCADLLPGSPFLRVLNRGDETPGRVRYGTWWSPCDELIAPPRSVELRGATNTRTACLSHGALLGDQKVYRQVRDFLR
jgi:triacylglycerol lipase